MVGPALPTASVVRLDERLWNSPACVREGWLARSLLAEAAASSRLNGDIIDEEDLILLDADTLDQAPSPELGRASAILAMLRSAARRSARQVFTPRRLAAVAAVRLVPRSGTSRRLPPWLEERLARGGDPLGALQRFLSPENLAQWRAADPLEAASSIIAAWHAGGCADEIGAAPGRALASAWLRRAGLTLGYVLMPSIGFLGHASEYRPDMPSRWRASFLAAADRAARRGLGLQARLARAKSAFDERSPALRSTSRRPLMCDLLVARPSLSAASAARHLGMTVQAASGMLEELRERHPDFVAELTGRQAFRLYGLR